ncbi:MAG: aspartyl/glutamyl-tRNA amidotransferase subunit C [Desulfurococcales archaeon]|nr:aspartyl/glutamyl-tRNA amidotransferase subunit C [Desulfurococcales archaeon]
MEDGCRAVRRAVELARIAFTSEELERLCKEASRIAEYLASVGEAVKGLDVEPLYHVWEEEGGLRDRIEDRRVPLESFLPPERLDGEGRVKVPWREVK